MSVLKLLDSTGHPAPERTDRNNNRTTPPQDSNVNNQTRSSKHHSEELNRIDDPNNPNYIPWKFRSEMSDTEFE